jgi:hypothetical protein
LRTFWRLPKIFPLTKNRKIKLLFLIVVLTIARLLQQLTTTPEGPPVLPPSTQGLYESCSPSKGNFCYERLKEMATGGFKLVINYDQLYGTPQQEIAYAQQAQAQGIKVIWAMNDPVFWNGADLRSQYADFATGCSCSNNLEFIRFFVALAKRQPATWGYYIGDEVDKQDHHRMKKFADLVKQLDPTHPRLFVSSEDLTTMGANLLPFVDTADVIGADIYPIGTTESIDAVGKIAHALQLIADRYHKPLILVLQAFSWAQYPQHAHKEWICSSSPDCVHFPTKDELLQMRDLSIKNANLHFLLWYSYFDIKNSKQAYDHFRDLKSVTSSPVNLRGNC